MKINVNEMRFYYLTYNNERRKAHMISEFADVSLKEINPVSRDNGINKVQSGATGFMRMLSMGTLEQNRELPFQPFALLEDDAKKYREFPEELQIPDDTDLLYIGLSRWGCLNGSNSSAGTYDAINCSEVSLYPSVCRVKNMFATHGIIICSLTGLLSLQKCVMEDYYMKRGYDITSTKLQPFINTYALRKPLVYQYGKVGGHERDTKFEINDEYIKEPEDYQDDMSTISYKTTCLEINRNT